jgi:hypothetical protein
MYSEIEVMLFPCYSPFLAFFFLFSLLYSKKVNRFVCSIFMARVASLASMTQLMLISLAPITSLISKALPE